MDLYDSPAYQWFQSLFYDEPCECAICEEGGHDIVLEICQNATALREADQPIRRVCDDCAQQMANLYSYRVEGRPQYDPENDWFLVKGKRPLSRKTTKTLSISKRLKVFERDKFKCIACGTQQDLTVDHIVAVANGGDNGMDNLQTLCRPCNASKGKRTDWTGRKDPVRS